MSSLVSSAAVSVGSLIERAGKRVKTWGAAAPTPFDVFLTPRMMRLNSARLEHLDSLQLDLARKQVLEVGAGIGSLTGFFERAGCDVISTEGREENVAEIARRFPHRLVRRLDLDDEAELSGLERLGNFSVVFCYGTLYHLTRPEQALKALATVCSEMILLETCVTPGNHVDAHPVRETPSYDQSIRQMGCRPTRPWIMKKLTEYWGHAYVSKRQPQFREFEVNWSIPFKLGNYRSVFVGCKHPLPAKETLLDYLPDLQARLGDPG